MNGYELDADEDGLVEITLKVATSQASKSEVADFSRSIAHPAE